MKGFCFLLFIIIGIFAQDECIEYAYYDDFDTGNIPFSGPISMNWTGNYESLFIFSSSYLNETVYNVPITPGVSVLSMQDGVTIVSEGNALAAFKLQREIIPLPSLIPNFISTWVRATLTLDRFSWAMNSTNATLARCYNVSINNTNGVHLNFNITGFIGITAQVHNCTIVGKSSVSCPLFPLSILPSGAATILDPTFLEWTITVPILITPTCPDVPLINQVNYDFFSLFGLGEAPAIEVVFETCPAPPPPPPSPTSSKLSPGEIVIIVILSICCLLFIIFLLYVLTRRIVSTKRKKRTPAKEEEIAPLLG